MDSAELVDAARFTHEMPGRRISFHCAALYPTSNKEQKQHSGFAHVSCDLSGGFK